MGQVKDDTWIPKGSYSHNLQVDNRKYEVMLDVETLKEHSSNDIVENIISIIGYEDRHVLGLGGISCDIPELLPNLKNLKLFYLS